MPVVHVPKTVFHNLLGGKIEFEVLQSTCFDYGIELEEDEETQEYLFETAANRPDMLCVESIALAMGIFLGYRKLPDYKILNQSDKIETMSVTDNVKPYRPYVVCAILRDIEFTEQSYKSFIDLQDKLHQTFFRKRKLVAVGTHDMAKFKFPCVYDCQKPEDIKFVPLNKKEEVDGNGMMELYQTDAHIKEFLPIIKDFPFYPVIRDAEGNILSVPPIINSDKTKMSKDTKNVFIESTATDYTRALQGLNVIISAFSQYCKNQFTVEEVEIKYSDHTEKTPVLQKNKFKTSLKNIRRLGTFDCTIQQAKDLLTKMEFQAEILNENEIEVEVPIFRSDVLQECDIIEDVCIAFGYNNIEKCLPSSFTVGKQYFLNKMSDLTRELITCAGYQEGLNFALNNVPELTQKMQQADESHIVKIGNPRTTEFTCGRSALLPGCLKWLQHNKNNSLPIKLFELGDVVYRTTENETGVKNERRLCALYSNNQARFEKMHGLLDYIMIKLHVALKGHTKEEDLKKYQNFYSIVPSNNPTYFPDRQADILVNGKQIGTMGILHPEVLKNYQWGYPISCLEINLEPIFENFDN